MPQNTSTPDGTAGGAARGDRPVRAGQTRRHALGDFLRSARARVAPEMVGLPPGVRRRTPGLRREEVAQLCGISVTWYTWIEQGRGVTVSPGVWARLAAVLRLARAERHYLFDLAECADPDHGDESPGPRLRDLADCVRRFDAPAYFLDRCWNMLASNRALLDLFGGWPKCDDRPNLLRYIFLDRAARSLVVDWERRARRVVAEFRADAGPHVDEPEVREVLDGLLAASPLFARWWTRQTVVAREGGVREFNHPARGLLTYRQMTFRLATRPDCKLVVLVPER
ncbi:MAG: XRE family transcriptional regulator [Candidimonas sp.]|nr:MAG: XRE family transcriptional regulator [Candidimonas sp.]